MRFSKNSFAYKLDYDKEIAQDEAAIARLETLLANEWLRGEQGEASTLVCILFQDPTQAEKLGFTRDDVVALAYSLESDRFNDERPVEWMARSGRLGEAICKLMACNHATLSDLPARVDVVAALRRAKASLARHKRNKLKFG